MCLLVYISSFLVSLSVSPHVLTWVQVLALPMPIPMSPSNRIVVY